MNITEFLARFEAGPAHKPGWFINSRGRLRRAPDPALPHEGPESGSWLECPISSLEGKPTNAWLKVANQVGLDSWRAEIVADAADLNLEASAPQATRRLQALRRRLLEAVGIYDEASDDEQETEEMTMSKRKPAQAIFLGWQEVPGKPAIELWNLHQDIPDHPAGSTVSRQTLLDAGFIVPIVPRQGEV